MTDTKWVIIEPAIGEDFTTVLEALINDGYVFTGNSKKFPLKMLHMFELERVEKEEK